MNPLLIFRSELFQLEAHEIKICKQMGIMYQRSAMPDSMLNARLKDAANNQKGQDVWGMQDLLNMTYADIGPCILTKKNPTHPKAMYSSVRY
jgi:hypothetical protein